jgi:membrane protein YqaA with SNARE-associated domain
VKPFARKLHLLVLVIASILGHARTWLSGLFMSKAEANRRSSDRLADIEQEANESERLDRLRNPSDYLGR